MLRASHLVALLGLVLSMAAIACARPDRQAANPFAGPPLTERDAIRQFNFANADSVQAAARFTNSTPDVAAIIYSDVTGDGQEEAIIPFSTGGTQGYVLYHVYRINGRAPELVLTRNAERNSGGIKMSVANGVLTETTGVFANEDPLCCPSRLKVTTFKWDGTKLQVATENTIANPNAPKG